MFREKLLDVLFANGAGVYRKYQIGKFFFYNVLRTIEFTGFDMEHFYKSLFIYLIRKGDLHTRNDLVADFGNIYITDIKNKICKSF